MSLLYAVVFASRCRSTHHRLAVDALRHLQSPDADAWRDLLLHYHKEYLDGAKAPDDEFKDFKNHVLHVRDNDWGGAIEACEEWYRRTVRALAQQNWAQAAWSAGVMSHYFVDPHQPFHTHQTEEEGVIHRAVEWSFNKSYLIFQKILEAGGGYPNLARPSGDKWLSQMLRAGAQEATKHYELIIEHYNFDVGAKDPPNGLDDELRQKIAGQVGLAAVGLSRVLDRAFEEAAVKPPKIGGDLQAFFLALEIPIQAVLKTIDDQKSRAEVEAQYAEFMRSGKVRKTLGEDDKVVRALYAAEVLKTPLSSLDAAWPRETGTKNIVTEKPAKAKQAAKPKAEKPAAAKKEETPKAAKPAKPAPVQAEAPPPVAPPAPQPVAAAPAPRPQLVAAKGALESDAPVVDAPSIGPKTGRKLEAIGVRTVADLLAVSPENAESQLKQRHISAQLIRDWQAQATLACSIPGLRSREAQALVACGVRDAVELSEHDPEELCEAIARWGLSDEGQRAWGAAPAPTEDDVAAWIESAHTTANAKAKTAA
ncbi:MAG: DUF4332 domain-containing protein [Hyphomonadaceae bacterium]|nr:DUF4332 domain-containing protein [Hyphomonadaceae bacterium]